MNIENVNGANLTTEEVQELAEEIRLAIVGHNQPILISDYIKAAQKVNSSILGFRLTNAIYNELQIGLFLPDEILKILRDKNITNPCFNKNDLEWITKNQSKGTQWLTSHLYSSIDTVRAKAKKLGIILERTINKNKHIYKNSEDAFIIKHRNKGYKWIAKQLGTTYESVESRFNKKIKKQLKSDLAKNKTENKSLTESKLSSCSPNQSLSDEKVHG